MTEAPAVPDWIYPGAPVVVYIDNHRRDDPEPRDTVVDRVAKLSFTVKALPRERFKLADQHSKQGSGWSNWSYVAVPPDSEKAAAVKAAHDRIRRDYRAWSAVDAWRRDRNRHNRLAAIAALQAVED